VFFSTPYLRGNIQVAAEHPVGMCLDFNGSRAFQGELNTGAANTRAPLNSEDDGWRRPVFLPPKGSRRSGPSKFFVAEIRGNTAIYPFDSTRDTYVVAPIAGISIFHALLASHFAPRQWSIREDAEHRKSKTYGIDDLDALEISV
jgi:hypothetical protein